MADRYWVGGSGTWNTTSTTNWSTASGGTGGASVPTAADSVFFDQAGTYTVTMTGALTCLDITVSAGTVTFANGTSPTLAISGSMSLIAGTVWSSTGAITFNATTTGKTVTTNGTVFPGSFAADAFIFNSTSGGWTLGSALTLTQGNINVNAGDFNTGGYNVTAGGQLVSLNNSVRAITLGASTVSLGGGISGGAPINFNATNLTFSAGTSQITINAQGAATLNGAGKTFNNVSFAATTGGSATRIITGANTFNNLSFAAQSSVVGVMGTTFDSPQTINGTLSTTGTAGNRRVFFSSSTYGLGQTLTINSASSLTDADFRDIYVIGTAAPISGTRIGNRGNCSGITFSAPKTVYWVNSATAGWSTNSWSSTDGGAASTDFFPLPQDTATFTNTNPSSGQIVNTDTLIPVLPTIDMSARTLAMTLSISGTGQVCYGDWKNGSGTTIANGNTLTFSGGNTQTITSAGKAFSCPVTIDTYGGTVQLADALNIGTQTLTVTNGTFDTKSYSVGLGAFASSNTNVRAIRLGSSTITSSLNTSAVYTFTTSTNLTLDAGTSTLLLSANSSVFDGGGLTFYNVRKIATAGVTAFSVAGSNTFNNLTVEPGTTNPQLNTFTLQASQVINGTLTCSGSSATQRVFVLSSTLGTQRTLTVGSLVANDCDFRDIVIAGAAAGASPTRAGDCGGNSGIMFPAPKTVYWNLTGSQNWSATAWATSSGGTPAVTNFPLAQDTAVFDNTGAATTVSFNFAWNVGTFNASSRTSAMTLTISAAQPTVYGNWLFGTGITTSGLANINFSKNGTQTITSNGVTFSTPITVNNPFGTVQLADALNITAASLLVSVGTFDAVSYNVTVGSCNIAVSTCIVKMGSGTWTITGTGSVWISNAQPIVGTSTIVLSDNSTTARTFSGGGFYYNKLTIGGATSTSTTTFGGNNFFGELASTKTVAHTIIFTSSQTTTIGKWSVTGTAGNVVTIAPSVAATTYTLSIAGPAASGINYLSLSYCAVSATSLGEFYVGANSTNTAGNTGPIFFTATPTPRTLFWVGGTGNWSATTSWSTSSGGASGAAIPTSLDSVTFDNLSNNANYTATIDAGVTLARCAALTVGAPSSGSLTLAGNTNIAIHGNTSFAATGVTRTYTGSITLSGASGSSYTFTTNGISFANTINISGVGVTWTLGSAFTSSGGINVNYGTFSTSVNNYSLACSSFVSNVTSVRAISLNASTVTCNLTSTVAFNFASTANLTFNAGTSTLVGSAPTSGIASGGLTFYNASFTSPSSNNIIITGSNTFNNLTFGARTSQFVGPASFGADQIIGTLTLNPSTDARYRTFIQSNTIGTQRTLTVTSFTAGAADYDFRDIAIAGAAAPISGTRFGDCKGNSGITFPAAKTVYWNSAGGGNWVGPAWATSPGGTADVNNFPLAQDTAVFLSTGLNSGSTVTLNASYNIGTIDMSARTSNTMTLAVSASAAVYGNWIGGTGITISGTSGLTFAGRGSQTITSAGVPFTQAITINSPSGSVSLQDALTLTTASGQLVLSAGTFNANTYNCTPKYFTSNVNGTRVLNAGSGTWVLDGTSVVWTIAGIGFSFTGTGTISLTGATAKTFQGNNVDYSGITLDNGGAGTLSINGNNTFKTITNSYSATGAATISLGSSTTTLTNPWTATGALGKVLTVSGTSGASPATLIYTGAGQAANVDYLAVSNIRAYPVFSSWYAGGNSTNGGSLGFRFAAFAPIFAAISEQSSATDSSQAAATYLAALSETLNALDSEIATRTTNNTVAEQASTADSGSAIQNMLAAISEQASVATTFASVATFATTISEASSVSDVVSALASLGASLQETSSAASTGQSGAILNAAVSELTGAVETLIARITTSASVSESASSNETAAALIRFACAITEAASGSSSVSSGFLVSLAIVEAASADSSLAIKTNLSTGVSEAVQSKDTPTVLQQLNVLQSEGAAITDSVLARALWEVIDDLENANWQNVANTQAPGWTDVDDKTDLDWQNIPT